VEAKLSDGDIQVTTPSLPNTTKASLRDKHPAHPEPTNYPTEDDGPTPPQMVLESGQSGDVVKAIRSFHPGSAGRLDAFRPQILKDLTAPSVGAAADSLLEALTTLVYLGLDGKLPTTFCPIFFGASLTALRKMCGGIRPVAVGNIGRRLVTKIVCARVAPALSGRFSPISWE